MNLAEIHSTYEEYCLEIASRPTISFDEIKRRFSKDENIWNELDRGRKILTNEQQLNQYLYSYGPMTKKQWEIVLQNYTPSSNKVQIFDYACGQGLATVLLLDKFYATSLSKVCAVALVEPSFIALKRARTILKEYIGNTDIFSINKKIDLLTQNDLSVKNDVDKIHLFSNILDIDDFDVVNFFNKIILNKGTHHFLAVSTDRECFGGTERLKDIYDILTDKKYSETIILKNTEMNKFIWKEDKKSIYFIVKMEVLEDTVLEDTLIEI